jgi:hypothetical protein
MILIQLHRKRKPFAIIVSNEVVGEIYSVIYQDRFIKSQELDRLNIRWFSDNRYLFRCVRGNQFGRIYEYKQFRRKMGAVLKHNFLVREQIIKGKFL